MIKFFLVFGVKDFYILTKINTKKINTKKINTNKINTNKINTKKKLIY